jgi:hypothetical protein
VKLFVIGHGSKKYERGFLFWEKQTPEKIPLEGKMEITPIPRF